MIALIPVTTLFYFIFSKKAMIESCIKSNRYTKLMLFFIVFLSSIYLESFATTMPGNQHSVFPYKQGSTQMVIDHNYMSAIELCSRKSLFDIIINSILKAATANDLLLGSLNSVSGNQVLFIDDPQQIEKKLNNFFLRLSTNHIPYKNITLLLALIYMDKFSASIGLYASSSTSIKIFGCCVVVASKVLNDKLDRVWVANALGIDIQDFLNSEIVVTNSIKDFSVDPTILSNYIALIKT